MIKFAPNKTILKIVSYHNQMDYGLLYLACFMKIFALKQIPLWYVR